MIYYKSVFEVAGIYAEAAVEVYHDARLWLGRVITEGLEKADQRLANQLNSPEDEL